MKVYLISTDEAEKLKLTVCNGLFPKRVSRSMDYKNEKDRLRILGAGALLHGALGINEELILKTPLGKPYLPEGQPHFNLSHSGKYSVLASDACEVGVDIEEILQKNLTAAEAVFTPDELEWMRADEVLRFHTLWTLKESYLKLTGSGLSVNPQLFSVLSAVTSGSATVFGIEYFFYSHCFDGHMLSLCSRNRFSEPEFIFCNADIIKPR